MQMGQGDASTVTMTFPLGVAISAEVSADIVGVRVVWGLDICQIFSGFVGRDGQNSIYSNNLKSRL
jgi:hypothetical protein